MDQGLDRRLEHNLCEKLDITSIQKKLYRTTCKAVTFVVKYWLLVATCLFNLDERKGFKHIRFQK